MGESTESQGEGFRNVLISLAAFVIIIAGMMAAKAIIIPILLSAFIAIIFSPALFWLESLKVPRVIAFIIVIAIVVGILTGLGAVLGTQITAFKDNLPNYQTQLKELTDSGLEMAKKYNITIPKDAEVFKNFDLGMVMGMTGNMIGNITSMLSQTLLIFITVAFILFETSSFPRKLANINIAENANDKEGNEKSDNDKSGNIFTGKIKRYLAIKTITSLATALIVALGLDYMELEYPYLWGMLAFFLNFIPSIGSILAAIPVLLLSLLTWDWTIMLGIAVAYTIVNVAIGNFIEPRFIGKELGLSPLVVFLSLIFWGWVLGPVGMFLSVPLTMAAKIAFDSREDTKWIGVLLGP